MVSHLGNRPYGYSSFQYELTPHLKFGGERTSWPSAPGCSSRARAGIRAPAFTGMCACTTTDSVHVAHWGTSVTTPEVSEREATVRVETKIRNQSVIGSDGRAGCSFSWTIPGAKFATGVAQSEGGGEIASVSSSRSLKLPNPRLWSLESPRLYHVQATVHVDGRVADEFVTPFGDPHVRVHGGQGVLPERQARGYERRLFAS